MHRLAKAFLVAMTMTAPVAISAPAVFAQTPIVTHTKAAKVHHSKNHVAHARKHRVAHRTHHAKHRVAMHRSTMHKAKA